jgi:hypothetical protein
MNPRYASGFAEQAQRFVRPHHHPTGPVSPTWHPGSSDCERRMSCVRPRMNTFELREAFA